MVHTFSMYCWVEDMLMLFFVHSDHIQQQDALEPKLLLSIHVNVDT